LLEESGRNEKWILSEMATNFDQELEQHQCSSQILFFLLLSKERK